MLTLDEKTLRRSYWVGCCLTAGSAEKKTPEIATKDWCFIATTGGKKWHAKRSCQTIKKSKDVRYVTIEQARKLGGGNKWKDGCYFCWGRHQKKK
jgi:hypothetical protein